MPRRRRIARVAVLLCAALASVSCSGGTATHRASAPARAAATSTTAAAATPRAPGPTAPAPTAPDPTGATSASDGVDEHEETFVDTTRATPANGGAPGSPVRSIATVFFVPHDRGGGPHPVVLFAHGYAVQPTTYRALLRSWAAAGTVVVAPTIPVLNGRAPGGASEADLDSAPKDLSFVLDRVIAGARAPDGWLAGLVDPSRVAASGHPDGQAIAFALADDPCCRDTRIRAVVALAGLLGTTGPEPLTSGVPVLHVIVDHDRYSDLDETIAFDRERLPAPHVTITLRDADHLPPFTDPVDRHFALVASVTRSFLDATLLGVPGAAGDLETVVDDNPQLATISSNSWLP